MKPTMELLQEYNDLFKSMVVNYTPEIDLIVRKILSEKKRYEAVEKETGIPWFVVACVHNMEGSLNFERQLHNGERWNKKTVMVPKGLGPWNSWHEAAVDAMNTMKVKLSKTFPEISNIPIPIVCYAFESHNGWGYRKFHSKVKSPYLWAGSNHYTQGKYVADGKWSDTAISKQVGAMVIVKAILEKDSVKVPVKTEPVEPIEEPKPIVVPEKKVLTFWEKIMNFFF